MINTKQRKLDITKVPSDFHGFNGFSISVQIIALYLVTILFSP